DCPMGLNDGRVAGTQEERLFVRRIERGLLARYEPVTAERGLEGIAVEVCAEREDTGLPAPVPLVLPVGLALLVRRAAPARWLGDLTSGRQDGVALGLGYLGHLFLRHAAAPEEEREAGLPLGVEDILPAQAAVLWRIVRPRLEPQGHVASDEEPLADPSVHRVERKAVRGVHTHVDTRIAAQEIQNALAAAGVKDESNGSDPDLRVVDVRRRGAGPVLQV